MNANQNQFNTGQNFYQQQNQQNNFNNGYQPNYNQQQQNQFTHSVNNNNNNNNSAPQQNCSNNVNKPKKSLSQTAKSALVSGIVAVVVCLLFCGVYGCKSNQVTIGGNSIDITQTEEADNLAEAVATMCLPSVLSINTYTSKKNEESLTALGSGVIISEDGYVITNQHVIEGASSVKVKLNEGEFSAKIIGADDSSDIAVIKIEGAPKLTAMALGDSDNIKIGEWVMALGNPFGLEQSVSTGIVSAKSRNQVVSSEKGSDKVYMNLIQTDAAINPGNSGGALVNKQGQLIGINTLIASSSGGFAGIGFAIPINYAINLGKQLMEGKTPTHAKLGVVMEDVNNSIAKHNNLKVTSGALVTESSGAAENAGIEPGDVIIECDGKEVSSSNDVLLAVRSSNIGDNIDLVVNRDGHNIKCVATLQ